MSIMNIPLPFTPSQTLLDLYADWDRIASLHTEAVLLPSFRDFAIRVADQLSKDITFANNHFTNTLYHDIGREYCDKMRVLLAADEQAVDTLTTPFLTADECEVVRHGNKYPAFLVDLWAKDSEALAFDRSILEKYAPALALGYTTTRVPSAHVTPDGHCDEMEDDYTAIIQVARLINNIK